MHGGRKNKLVKLLEDTPEKWYWLGFLLADGYFNSNGRLKVVLSLKDQEHLYRFRDFIGYGNVKTYGDNCEWQVMDVATCAILRETFKISNRKTYYPPELFTLTSEQVFCLSIGFIDGDGTISRQHNRKGSYISVKVHNSWLDTLKLLFPNHEPYLQNSGYAVINISDTKSVRFYKSRSVELNLPLLERKWSVIDDEFVSRQEKSDHNKVKIAEMLKEGFTQKEISEILDLSNSNLSQLIKRNNLKELHLG